MPAATVSPARGMGWRPDLPDRRDHLFTAPQPLLAALPRTVDLTGRMPPVFDQGPIGSCTSQSVTVNITGTNDAAVIGGVTTGALTETDAALTTSGALTLTDVDSAATFVAQASTAGSNNYGTFTLATNGAWTYTMGSAHNEFVAGQTYKDRFTAVSADGTTQLVTVTITGTNDAVAISGVSTAALTETNAAQTASGTLVATDVDGTANLFTAQTDVAGSNGYGKFTVTTAGVWMTPQRRMSSGSSIFRMSTSTPVASAISSATTRPSDTRAPTRNALCRFGGSRSSSTVNEKPSEGVRKSLSNE